MTARKARHRRKWTAPQWITTGLFIALVSAPTWWLYRSVRIAKVPSESMQPALVPGDVLAVRIDAYRREAPQRGDIVILRSPAGGEWLVKRVVGVPGEQIVVFSGRVLTQAGWLVEPYAEGGKIRERPLEVALGTDELFVMGDNRDHAEDSRDFGPVKRTAIVGRVAGIIFPWARRSVIPRFVRGSEVPGETP